MTQTISNNLSDILVVDVQIELEEEEGEEPPSSDELCGWAQNAYSAVSDVPAEVTLRITGAHEMTHLNTTFRGKEGATNVLSFPFDRSELPDEFDVGLLGDVVMCHPVVLQEAAEQSKTTRSHYAHMVTHGVLHLCGYDHEEDEPAQIMEALESRILRQQGFADPYAESNQLSETS